VGGFVPLTYPFLGVFVLWFVGAFRHLKPNGETLVAFGVLVYVIGILLGAIYEATATSSGVNGVLNNFFDMSVFTQRDAGIIGFVFASIHAGWNMLVGILQTLYWDFAFWNDAGIIKWIFWLPSTAAVFIFGATRFFGR